MNSYQPRQPFVNPRNPTINRTIVPERKIDDALITKSLLLVADGDYFKIREFLLTNNTSLSYASSSGDTALHLIIKNENLSSHDKLELCKLAVENGAKVSATDQFDITPLHLAAKYQLTELIKYLVKNGADVKSLDSQLKTPLHYAIVGTSTQCPNVNDQKIMPIVPSDPKKIDQNKQLSDIYASLTEFMYEDVNINRLISHIKNTMAQSNKMFIEDIDDKITVAKQKVSDIISASSAPNGKKKQISDLIYENKQAFSEFLTDKLKDLLIENTDIKPNNIAGWGPDNDRTDAINRVLKQPSAKYIFNNYSQAVEQEIGENTMELQQASIKLSQHILSLVDFGTKTMIALGHAVMYNQALGEMFNTNGIPGQIDWKELFNLYVANYGKIRLPTIGSIVRVNIGDFSDPTFPADHIEIKNPEKFWNPSSTVDEFLYEPVSFRYDPTIVAVPENPEGSEKEVKQWRKNRDPKATIKVKIIDPASIMTPANNGVYFMSLYNAFAFVLDRSVTNIMQTANNISTALNDNKEIIDIYDYSVPLAVADCLTIANTLEYIKKLETVVTLTRIKDLFVERRKTIAPNGVDTVTGAYLYEQVESELDGIIKIGMNLSDIINSTYKSTKYIMDKLNGIVSCAEAFSAINIIRYFNNNFIDDLTIVNNEKTSIQDLPIPSPALPNPTRTTVFNTPIKKLISLPDSFNEFVGYLIRTDKDQTSKILIENYMPQIYEKNPVSYLSDDVTYLPTAGYIITDDFTYNPSFAPTTIQKVAVPDVVSINSAPTIIYGKLGNVNRTLITKLNAVPPVIGKLLDGHLNIIKYLIVKYVINDVYNKLSNNIPSPLANQLAQMRIDIKEYVHLDDTNYSVILTMVGKMTDDILVNLLKGLITIESSKLSLIIINELKDKSLNNYSDLLNEIKKLIDDDKKKVILKNKEYSTQLNLNDILLYTIEHISPYTYGTSLSSVGEIVDQFEGKKNIHKVDNFRYDLHSVETLCLKIDPDTTNTLLKLGAQVNAKDNLGKSVLYYALEIQHRELIDMLINDYGAIVSNERAINKFGITPLEFCWKHYTTNVLPLVTNFANVIQDSSKKIMDLIKKKYGNNLLRYSKQLIPIAIYLLNHQLYITGKKYPKNWNFEQNRAMEFMLFGNKELSLLPLLDTVMNDDDENMYEMHLGITKKASKDINTLTNAIDDLSKQLINFHKELTSLTGQTSLNAQARIIELNTLIFDMNNELAIKVQEKARLEKMSGDIKNEVNLRSANEINTFNRNIVRLNKKNSCVDIYNSVKRNVIDAPAMTALDLSSKKYQLLWKKHITMPISPDNYTQILYHLTNYQSFVISQTKNINSQINDLLIISAYYQNVVMPFADNYFTLPQELKTVNTQLNNVVDILEHIVKHFICVNLYHIIIKFLIKHITNVFPKNTITTEEQYQQYVEQLVRDVIFDDKVKHESKLRKYLFGDMPRKIVKITLKIYEGENNGENDSDRNLDLDKLLSNLSNILQLNIIVPLDQTSSIISNLKTYIYPYFKDYIELFVTEMKLCIDGYLHNLMYQAKTLSIMDTLATKANLEVKK